MTCYKRKEVLTGTDPVGRKKYGLRMAFKAKMSLEVTIWEVSVNINGRFIFITNCHDRGRSNDQTRTT